MPKPKSDPVREYLSKIGRKGGEAKVTKGIGTLTEGERKQLARKAAKARWSKTKKKVRIALAVLLLAITMPSQVANSQGCSAPPPPPPPPPGCRELVPVCTCDQHGRNCKYTWQCVPN